jgi:RNA polymerase sigma-70 factor (ECF subfamily)
LGTAAENARFAEVALPHLDAAYNLARWLTRDPSDAADVVQEAMMRALRFFGGYRGDNGKAWLLAIVRNTAFSWLKANRPAEIATGWPDREDGAGLDLDGFRSPEDDPEVALIRAGEKRQLDALIAALPAEFRECLVLREMEELSYKEIAAVTGVPIGTVMSRLARARRLVQHGWTRSLQEERS